MDRLSEDIQDMLAFQAGDEQAFQRLFERYKGPIRNYLYRFMGNLPVAEELTQEVFINVCRAAKTYEARTAFRYWIYRIATNVARNEVRRREYSVRKVPFGLPGSKENGHMMEKYPEPGGDSPEKNLQAKRLEGAIQEVMERLSEKQKTALLLCRQNGFSYREIGKIMNLRQGAVKSLIHRGTEVLRNALAPYLEPGPEQAVNPQAGGKE